MRVGACGSRSCLRNSYPRIRRSKSEAQAAEALKNDCQPTCGRQIREADQLAARRGRTDACRHARSWYPRRLLRSSHFVSSIERPDGTGAAMRSRPTLPMRSQRRTSPRSSKSVGRSTGRKIGPCSSRGRPVRARVLEEGSGCPRPWPWPKAKAQEHRRVQRMIKIDHIASIQIQIDGKLAGVRTRTGVAPLTLSIRGHRSLRTIHAPRLSATKSRLEIRAAARFVNFSRSRGGSR